MPVIKQRGAASKPASRTAKSKTTTPAKRGTTSRKSATKPAAKRTTTTRKPAAKKEAPQRVNRSPKTDMSARELKSFLAPLEKIGVKRTKQYEDWKGTVEESNELILAALEAEVPVNMIVEAAQVTRQHIYKLLGQQDDKPKAKSNGRAPAKPKAAPKRAAKRPAAKTPAKRKVAAKRPASKPAAGAKRKIVRRG